MFQLTVDEAARLRSQIVTIEPGRGRHRKYRPYAFTEQGVAMLSGVLRSRAAVRVNVGIMRAFVRLRRILDSNAELAKRLDELERRYRRSAALSPSTPLIHRTSGTIRAKSASSSAGSRALVACASVSARPRVNDWSFNHGAAGWSGA
jgi:hypothetical protein